MASIRGKCPYCVRKLFQGTEEDTIRVEALAQLEAAAVVILALDIAATAAPGQGVDLDHAADLPPVIGPMVVGNTLTLAVDPRVVAIVHLLMRIGGLQKKRQ